MSESEDHPFLGRIVYKTKAVEKMKQYGLYRYHIVDALRYGFDVKPLIPGTRQRAYLHDQEKQIEVVFTTQDKHGNDLGAIFVITCWARNVK